MVLRVEQTLKCCLFKLPHKLPSILSKTRAAISTAAAAAACAFVAPRDSLLRVCCLESVLVWMVPEGDPAQGLLLHAVFTAVRLLAGLHARTVLGLQAMPLHGRCSCYLLCSRGQAHMPSP